VLRNALVEIGSLRVCPEKELTEAKHSTVEKYEMHVMREKNAITLRKMPPRWYGKIIFEGWNQNPSIALRVPFSQ
jgi:hypothetical protein